MVADPFRESVQAGFAAPLARFSFPSATAVQSASGAGQFIDLPDFQMPQSFAPPPQPAPQPQPQITPPSFTGAAGLMGPDGRSREDVEAAGTYLSDAERAWFLSTAPSALAPEATAWLQGFVVEEQTKQQAQEILAPPVTPPAPGAITLEAGPEELGARPTQAFRDPSIDPDIFALTGGLGLRGAGLLPEEPAPEEGGGGFLGNILEQAPRLGEFALNQLLGPEIPGLQGVQEQAGDIARSFVESPAGRVIDPLGVVPGGVAEFAGEAVVPTRPGELALEAVPGVGFAPDIARAGRRLFPEGGGLFAGVPGDPGDLAGQVRRAAEEAEIPPVRPGEAAQPPVGAGVVPEAPGAPGAIAAPPAEGFAANIRLSKLPEDIRGTVREWADANPEAVQTARRGVRPDAEVLTDARQLVDEIGGNFDKIQRQWKPGEAWNAEEITAIRGTLRQKTDAVMEAARAAQVDNSAANHARLFNAIQEQSRVQQIVHGTTAEAGRALRAFRQEAFDAITANDTRRLEELLRRIAPRGKGFSTRDKLDEIAAGVANLDLDNPYAVNNFLRDVSKPGLWDHIMEVWINGILSGPKTHIVNVLSNTAMTALSPVERGLAAAIDAPLARLQSRPVARFFEEVPADAFGALSGVPEGVRGALSTLRHGITPGAASKWEFRRTAFKGTLGRIIRAPGTALEAGDTLNFTINYRAALNANIMRQARREGLKGNALTDRVAELKAAPTEALIREASATAERRLFREPSELSSAVIQLRDKVPATRFIIPFVRTPVNLVKEGLARSPLGLANPSLWRNLVQKNPEASDQLARVFLGSSISAALALGFAKGNITAGVPFNRAERDRFFREGKLPFAVNLGGEWVQFQRLEPWNVPLTMIAGAVDAMNDDEESSAWDIFGQAAFTIGQNITDQSFLSGLNDFMTAIDQPEMAAETFAGRQLGSAVPFSSALRTVAQGIDPAIRQPEGVLERAATGIPGVSELLPARQTALGEDIQRPEGAAFFPIQISPERQSAVDAELERIGMEVGFVGKSIAGHSLSREQQQFYQQNAGQVTGAVLSEIVQAPAYQAASDVDKEKMIEQTVSRSRQAVRDRLLVIVERLEDSPTFQGLGEEDKAREVARAIDLAIENWEALVAP